MDKIKRLYESKVVKIDEFDGNRVTALRFAAQYDHPEIVTYLLSLGSSTKIRAKDGIDPLLSAVEKRHVNIVRILLGACTSFHAPREQRSKGALLEHNSRAKDVRGAKEQRSKGAKEQRKIKSAPMQREHWSKGAKEQRSKGAKED